MQAYFNGVHIPGLLSLRTLVAKLVSATFVLAAGLIAEGEAPFVHIGTIVGGGITAAGSRRAPERCQCIRHIRRSLLFIEALPERDEKLHWVLGG